MMKKIKTFKAFESNYIHDLFKDSHAALNKSKLIPIKKVLDKKGFPTQQNIKDITNAVDIVTHIGGKTFDWTDEYITKHGGEDGYFIRKSDFGVIAQDVEKVFPLAIRTRPDGLLAVDYEKLCALAFAAIKELKDEIEILKGNSK